MGMFRAPGRWPRAKYSGARASTSVTFSRRASFDFSSSRVIVWDMATPLGAALVGKVGAFAPPRRRDIMPDGLSGQRLIEGRPDLVLLRVKLCVVVGGALFQRLVERAARHPRRRPVAAENVHP